MPKPTVDLDIALKAISDDLDAMGDEIANGAGQVAQCIEDVRSCRDAITGVDHKLDTLLDLFRQEVLPAIQEIPRLRRRIVFLENPNLTDHRLDGE